MKKIEKLTKEIAIKEVDKIKSIAHADDVAHEAEDNLYFWFITCVSKGMYNQKEAKDIATIIKSTSEIDFGRWFD